MDERTRSLLSKAWLGGELAVVAGSTGALVLTRGTRRAEQFLLYGTLFNTAALLLAALAARRPSPSAP